MEKRCTCGVGYVRMSEPLDGSESTIEDGQNMLLHWGTVSCAACSKVLYEPKKG